MPIDVQLPVLGDQDTVLTHTLTATLGAATYMSMRVNANQHLTWYEPNILLGAAGSSRLFEDLTQPYYLRGFSVDRSRIGVNSFNITTGPDTTSAGSVNLRPLTGTVQISLNDANDQEIAVVSDPRPLPASGVDRNTIFTYKRNNVDFSSTFANFINLYNQSTDANKAATLLTISAEEVLARHTPPITVRSSTSVSAIAGEPDSFFSSFYFRWRSPRIALPASSLFTDDTEYYAVADIRSASTPIYVYTTPTSLAHRTISSVLINQNITLRMTAGNLELINDDISDNSTGYRYFQDGSELPNDFSSFLALYNALSTEDKAATRLTFSAEVEMPVAAIASVTTKPPLKDIEYITFRVRSG